MAETLTGRDCWRGRVPSVAGMGRGTEGGRVMKRFMALILLVFATSAAGQEVHGIFDFAFWRETKNQNMLGNRYTVSGYAYWSKNKDGKQRVFLMEKGNVWGYAELRPDQVAAAEKLPGDRPTTVRVIVEGEYLGTRNTTRVWFRDAKLVRVFPPE